MKTYLTVKVLNPTADKCWFERCLADFDLSHLDADGLVTSLHLLFPNGIVEFSSRQPKNV